MKIAYFDCFSGVSGDMILGALIDAGLDLKELKLELDKLGISGYSIKADKRVKNGIAGIKVDVDITESGVKRRLKDIVRIVEESRLDEDIKNLSKETFKELARVEAKIHAKDIEEMHFHELGGLDFLIDVVSAFIGIKKLGIENIYSSRIHVGTGFFKCHHGLLPVPAPATVELLRGLPLYSKGIEAELVTPTGASILKSISKDFGIMPEMKIEKIGYGIGTRDLLIPNLLRVSIGESVNSEYGIDEVVLVETNIDNMNPEILAYTTEALSAKGALDVFATPIVMKKNRSATMLSILVMQEKLDEILSTVFAETTTFGVRIYHLERKRLLREVVSIETPFGKIRVNIGKVGDQIKSVVPEYEDCKDIAMKRGVSLKSIYDEARERAQKSLSQADSSPLVK